MSDLFKKLCKAIGNHAADQVRKRLEKGKCPNHGCNRRLYKDSPHCGNRKCAVWAWQLEENGVDLAAFRK